jgi:hypothetical protein
MAKYVSPGMVKGGLNATATCNRVTVLSGVTATPVLADITTTYKLATGAMTAGTDQPLTAGSGDSWLATMASKSGLSISTSGTAIYVAIDNGTDFVITTCTSQALTSGGTVTVPSWTQLIGPSA